MHPMLIMFLVIAGVVATTFLFIFWAVINVIRGAGRLIFGPGTQRGPASMIQQSPVFGPVRLCDRGSCRGLNPLEARFCRRCGQKLEMPQQVPVRRAAML